MDRIAALRNIEDALSAFEAGEIDLATLQERIQTILQTYATEFSMDQQAVYRVGDRILVAASPSEARDRAAAQADAEFDPDRVTVDRLSE